MSNKLKFLPVLLVLILFTVGAVAQTETGQISGVVTDQSGAVIPNAQVTATAVNTQTVRTATTSGVGSYIITNLQPGLYEVTVTAGNFAPFKRRVEVYVGSKVPLDAAMSVTANDTVVEVVGQGAVQVNTEKTEVSEVISEKQIQNLPTFNRNPYRLVDLSGNISPADPSGRGVGVALNGQRAAATGITLDGADNVDLFTASLAQSVPLDAVQEFSVISNNFGAESGRASAGIVNVATKSGTNAFHGSLYEFYRGSRLAANTFDNNANGVEKPRFVRNQFGYSFGGPVVKDKIFFFNSTEWTRVRSADTQRILVAAPEFIAASNQNTKDFYAQFGSQLVATPVATITKGDLGLTTGGSFDALPASTPIFNEIDFSVPSDSGGGDPQNTYSTTTRVDINATNKTSIFGRYSVTKTDQFAGSVAFSPYKGYSTGAENYGANYLASVTHVFSPKIVSQTKVVYNRTRNDQPLGENDPGPTLYFRAVTTRVVTPNGNLRVAGPGYLPFSPGSAIPFAGPQNLYQINEDVNWTAGKHQFRFGGQYIHTRDNRTFGAFLNSVENLSNAGLSAGLQNFVDGNLARFQGAVDPQGKFPCAKDVNQITVITPECTVTLPVGPPNFSRNNRYNDSALYVSDAWKVTPRLTVNLGVRWEYYGVQHNADPNLDSNFYFGSGANIFEQIRNGQGFRAPDSGSLQSGT